MGKQKTGGRIMKKVINKGVLVLLSFTLLILSFSSTQQSANAASATSAIQNSYSSVDFNSFQFETLDISDIKNLNDILGKLSQSDKDIYSSYVLDEDVESGVINIYNSKEDQYYNLYVEGDLITYYSKQYYTEKDDVNFELYSITGDNYIRHEFTSSVSKNTGEIEHVIGVNSVDPVAFKWACIFSSYISCAVAAGALGWVIGGPIGSAAAAFACRYVFQTLVEKYGTKERACKIFSPA